MYIESKPTKIMSHHRHDHQPQLLRPQKHTHDAIQIVVRIRRQYDPSGGGIRMFDGFCTRERNKIPYKNSRYFARYKILFIYY
mmetsp:Transcript_19291/g.46595  ORF Transcript_19291/g.46595 Transcript_19291/m.46595 type:complete len:83 (-) Transcript_19291:1195-1443(-)